MAWREIDVQSKNYSGQQANLQCNAKCQVERSRQLSALEAQMTCCRSMDVIAFLHVCPGGGTVAIRMLIGESVGNSG